MPLHPGTCPKWLFPLMRKLSREMGRAIVREHGGAELVRRLADPMFFQAWGCVIGFDWQSSGLTTTTAAAIREAGIEGIAVCGGKGKTGQKTPQQIEEKGEEFGLSISKIESMKYASRLAAKVDGCCVQDGYELYHHAFMFDERGEWAVIQQGMNGASKYARRYHWTRTDAFVDAPPHSIMGFQHPQVLNTVSRESAETRKASVDLANENPARLRKYFTGQSTLFDDGGFTFPAHHEIFREDLPEKDWELLGKVYEYQPKTYEELVAFRGMGAKKLRALALVSRLVFGCEPDWKDPVKYSFAHGGKDGIPFPVQREEYAHSIRFLRNALEAAELGRDEKILALKRLAQ